MNIASGGLWTSRSTNMVSSRSYLGIMMLAPDVNSSSASFLISSASRLALETSSACSAKSYSFNLGSNLFTSSVEPLEPTLLVLDLLDLFDFLEPLDPLDAFDAVLSYVVFILLSRPADMLRTAASSIRFSGPSVLASFSCRRSDMRASSLESPYKRLSVMSPDSMSPLMLVCTG